MLLDSGLDSRWVPKQTNGLWIRQISISSSCQSVARSHARTPPSTHPHIHTSTRDRLISIDRLPTRSRGVHDNTHTLSREPDISLPIEPTTSEPTNTKLDEYSSSNQVIASDASRGYGGGHRCCRGLGCCHQLIDIRLHGIGVGVSSSEHHDLDHASVAARAQTQRRRTQHDLGSRARGLDAYPTTDTESDPSTIDLGRCQHVALGWLSISIS